MIDWKRKLTSRKLWLSVANFAMDIMVFFGASQSEAVKVAAMIMAGATVIGYTIGEGLADNGNQTEGKTEGKTDDGAAESN